MKSYIVHYRFTTQVGPDAWSQVSDYLICTPETSLKKIMEWVDSHATTSFIRIELSETTEASDEKKS